MTVSLKYRGRISEKRISGREIFSKQCPEEEFSLNMNRKFHESVALSIKTFKNIDSVRFIWVENRIVSSQIIFSFSKFQLNSTVYTFSKYIQNIKCIPKGRTFSSYHFFDFLSLQHRTNPIFSFDILFKSVQCWLWPP